MKKLLITAAIALTLNACGNQKSGSDSAAETPQQIEEATMAGRAAARRIVNRVFNDSSELHGLILEANAEKSRYQLEKKHQCEAAYDSAFIATIRVTRPDLADMLK